MEELIAAPDLMVAEWANVLSAKTLRRAIDRDLTGAGLAAMLAMRVNFGSGRMPIGGGWRAHRKT